MKASPTFSMFLAIALCHCTFVVDSTLDDKPSVDGGTQADIFCRGQADGTDCSTAGLPDHLCVAFACVERGCGDRYVDAERGEECDDGNTIPNDGCENDCTITCHIDADCDDGNACNGEEMCGRNADDLPVCGPDPTTLLPPVGESCEYEGGNGETVAGVCDEAGDCGPG